MSAISVGGITFLRRYSDFSVAEVLIPHGAPSLRRHSHDRAQLHLVLEGAYTEDCRGQERILGPGAALFRPGGELHSNRFHNEVHGLLIEIDAGAFARLLPGLDIAHPRYFPAYAFTDLCRLYDQEARDSEVRDHVMKAVGLLLAARISFYSRRHQREKSPPVWILNAMGSVRARYTEDLRLSALAAELGVSPAHLALEFRAHTGKSVGEYLIAIRLQRAWEDVTRSSKPFMEIAVENGFYDQPHLIRLFKRNYGVTPAVLRRRALR